MLDLIIIVVFMTFIFFYGTYVEKSHLRDLRNREKELNSIPWRSSGKRGEGFADVLDSKLLRGNVVVAQDAFKCLIAGIINIFGGRVGVYESLLDRGRREAICRLREQAKFFGCNEIVNVRLETSTINVNSSQTIEVLAYGTGVIKPNG